MTCSRVARPARQRWALLQLAVLAQAGEPSGGEDERGDWQTSPRLDLSTSSFYVDTRPKLGSLTPALNQRKVWLGKAAAFGACVSCSLVYRYVEHSGKQVPILDVLPKGELPKEGAEKECACGVGSSPREDAHIQPTPQHHAWLGSLLLALLAVAAVLSGGKGRRLSGHGRQTSGTSSVTLLPRARRGKESSHSTTDSTEFGHDSESDQEDVSPEPKQTRTAEAAARERARRRSPLPPAGAMRRQQTEPCAENGGARRSRKASRGGENRAPRTRSTPGPKARKPASEVDQLKYAAGGFVRQKTEELENRIDFYRMASEKSVQGEAEACRPSANSGAIFYRIGTENA